MKKLGYLFMILSMITATSGKGLYAYDNIVITGGSTSIISGKEANLIATISGTYTYSGGEVSTEVQSDDE